ncbi:MAG: tRNA (adenosine(37)-N6)-threonylcarbamoyltransferase complex dimerization subunit type 1 TsaB [Candidatus Eisenbacteria bacterium]|nr:tRNA (adenosine(37)-N6)-threonylcarbamoyltransferase complex dimerization subunit type 1 TsaB [Candidatus Eisenbacteria bacterium]
MTGLAIEAATEHVEVAVVSPDGVLAHLVENVGHGHTRRLTPLVMQALAEARTAPDSLAWVGADLGPGSFTGVRVGLATARAFAFASGARLSGASSLAALAHASPARRALVVPLVNAGRRDVYAGFYRVDARGATSQLAAPRVLPAEALREAVAEALALLPGHTVRFIGPGAGRERERLERWHPTSTALEFRHDGLSALDLAAAVRLPDGPGGGLPAAGREAEPVYVRSAQAEERVRRAVSGAVPITLRDLREDDLPAVVAIEQRVFGDPWPESLFRELLTTPERSSAAGRYFSRARVAEREGAIAGYAVSTVGEPAASLENLATAPGQRRNGVARALLADLFEHGATHGVRTVTLEVRASNAAAQALYRAYGFRLAGLRRGYYTHPLEDALLMTAPLDTALAIARGEG